MLKLSKVSVICGLLALFALSAAFGQTFTLSTTTLSAAVAKTDTQVCVASATGISVPTVSAPGTMLFMDLEPMQVAAAGTSSTCFVVDRHWAPGTHVSGQTLYLGPPQQFGNEDANVGGGCTASSLYVLPWINLADGRIFDCRSSGQWIEIGHGTGSDGSVETIRAFCTGTAGSGETEYLNGAACSGATTATARYVVPQFGTLANLRISLSAAGAGGTGKDLLTVYKNGSSTTLTLNTSTTACATAAAAACIDAAHSVAVAPGDVITFQFVTASSDTAANMSVSLGRY